MALANLLENLSFCMFTSKVTEAEGNVFSRSMSLIIAVTCHVWTCRKTVETHVRSSLSYTLF